MDAKAFSERSPGHLTACAMGGFAFLPDALPPGGLANVLGPLAARIAAAESALGELNGAATGLANPNLLIRPLERLEAIASSRMEGTETELTELLVHEDDEVGETGATREVANYARALRACIETLPLLPVSARLIRRAHAELLAGLSPARARAEPGEFRRVQNWISGPLPGIEHARFVPPPPNAVGSLISSLEDFIHAERFGGLPPLVHAALVHYFFETVHPFADGNGRVGRLLIPLILLEKNALRQPLLHMSPELELRRERYLDLLLDVSLTGNWADWIDFFLTQAEASCARALTTMRALAAYRRQVDQLVLTPRSSALATKVVDELFARPLITIPQVRNLLGVSFRAAQLHLERLTVPGFLMTDDTARPRRYIAGGVIAIIEGRAPPPLTRRLTA